jgi:two-component system, NtrC family, sensor kinase
MSDPAAELARLTREVQFHQGLRELFLLFARNVTTALSLDAALDRLVNDLTALLGMSRTSIWLHDRRARQLTLKASSDSRRAGSAPRVATDDPTHPAARGLRLERAEHLIGDVPTVVAPIRGWRRALGTLVIEGGGDERTVEAAHETARQLGVAIENVQLLDEILRQRRLLEDTFNSLVDLVIVLDRHGRIVQTNEAFAVRAGVARRELMDARIEELVGPETAAWLAAADPALASAPGGGTQQIEDRRLGGMFLLTATPLINQEGLAVGRVIVARDITRQTRLESERAALRERLAQSEKLASLGQFVAGIAHEMNNPLQGVLGHLELLMEVSEAARPLRRDLRQIYLDADRAAKIVRNLLVFTGSRRMARRRIQLDRIVTRAIASRAPNLKRAGIELVRTQGDGLPPILADPLLLQQALLNIFINAEHAIVDSPGDVRRIDVNTTCDAARERVTVAIRDSGTGISAEVLPRIFDPFFTTKDVGKGTGLGLAITYGIVQEHGGTIVVENAPGGGAVFRVDLPAAELVK